MHARSLSSVIVKLASVFKRGDLYGPNRKLLQLHFYFQLRPRPYVWGEILSFQKRPQYIPEPITVDHGEVPYFAHWFDSAPRT